jgi:hypothetical protein
VEDAALRVLAAANQPDYRTIADFCKIHQKALEGLFQQVLRLAMKADTIKLVCVALDGSKVKANASKHKSMSCGRIWQEEIALKKDVRRLHDQAEAADDESVRYVKGGAGDAGISPIGIQRVSCRSRLLFPIAMPDILIAPQ